MTESNKNDSAINFLENRVKEGGKGLREIIENLMFFLFSW